MRWNGCGLYSDCPTSSSKLGSGIISSVNAIRSSRAVRIARLRFSSLSWMSCSALVDRSCLYFAIGTSGSFLIVTFGLELIVFGSTGVGCGPFTGEVWWV